MAQLPPLVLVYHIPLQIAYATFWGLREPQFDLYVLKVNPSKARTKLQPKQGTFGFQVYLYGVS